VSKRSFAIGDIHGCCKTFRHGAVDEEANIIAGILIDDELGGNIMVVTMAKKAVSR
jgi:cell division GTPase FtsZ